MKRDNNCYFARKMAYGFLAAGLLLSAKAKASDFIYQFNATFSGTSPTGSAPWLTAEFQDVGSGKVDLTLSSSGLQGTEFISDFYLNLNPSMDPTSLAFNQLSKTGGFTDPSISKGINTFKADGDGYYDVNLGFDTSNGSTFTVGDSVTYQISGIAGLNANDFDYTSEMGGGAGVWLAAAHIQSIGGGGASGWIAPTVLAPVPEPAPVALLLTAAGIWFGMRRLRNCAAQKA